LEKPGGRRWEGYVARDGGPKNTWRGRNLKGTREIKTVALGLTDTTLPATFITPFLAGTNRLL
jgi:hypothetical protein